MRVKLIQCAKGQYAEPKQTVISYAGLIITF